MEYEVGKRYNVATLVANDPICYGGTPDIITCHAVDEFGRMWSRDILWRGVSDKNEGWCVAALHNLRCGQVFLVDRTTRRTSMKFEVGKQYDVSKFVAQNQDRFDGTPDIVTCHHVDSDGDMWTLDAVWFGNKGYWAWGWCLATPADLRNGFVSSVEKA